MTQQNEECDDGNKDDDDGCSAKCNFESCGDNDLQGEEECDDGNVSNTDACVNCKHAICGDGVTWQGHESCDDGNDIDTDGCINCELATCGDSFVWAGQEECDDGNESNLDVCLNTCKQASCGDGFVGPGEECDDGNTSNQDPCIDGCKINVCGDGYVDATTEGCDDSNFDDNDGCSNECEMGAVALGGGPQAKHFCAIREGEVRCWGYNASGQLGLGSKANLGDDQDLPDLAMDVPANNAGTKVIQVVAGSDHTCVILDSEDPNEDNSVRCWGANHYGLLGFGKFGGVYGDQPDELPTPLVEIDAIDIATGRLHTCAVIRDGGVRCWGRQDSGQLGQSGVNSGQSPTSMPNIDLGGNAKQVAVGETHSCALLEDKTVRCWGKNSSGQLGLNKTFDELPSLGDKPDNPPSSAPPVNVGEQVVQVAAGGNHTCVVTESGSVRCWGDGGYGVLGYGNSLNVGDDEHPADVGDVHMLAEGDVAVKVVTSRYHTCVLLDAGDVRCWGYGGLLGTGKTLGYGSKDKKPPLVNLDGTAIDIATNGVNLSWGAEESTCALLEGGRIRCWGSNKAGQLGRGDTLKIGDGPGEMPPPDSKIYPNP